VGVPRLPRLLGCWRHFRNIARALSKGPKIGKSGVDQERGDGVSHFTRTRTKLSDAETLRGALEAMGYKVLPPGAGVMGFAGGKAKAEFKIKPGMSDYEIGFVASKDGYSIVADWWGLRGLEQQSFVQALTQGYARFATVSSLAAEGFEIQDEVVDDEGVIRLTLSRIGA
jgi:hypothetical protein